MLSLLTQQVMQDIDECHLGQHKCKPGRCVNTVGSYACVNEPKPACPAGYKPSSDVTKQCEEVDECRENVDSCDPHSETCINEIGSYRCEPVMSSIRNESRIPSLRSAHTRRNNEENRVDVCPAGYSYSYSRKTCLDMDECLMDLHNCSLKDGEVCVNMPGSFMCRLSPKCPQGYHYNNRTLKCEDEDECTLGTNNCNPSERCVNNPGSFSCHPVCRAGYQLDPKNPQTCIDIDECQQKVDTCHRKRERCRNTEGSFICEPMYQCQPGYKKTQHEECLDIDECAENRHNCIQGVQLCVNTLGGYNCVDQRAACGHGFRYNSTALYCEDIDECEEKFHNCNPVTQICVNTQGSFECQNRHRAPTQASCPVGFQLDSDSQTCVDINECADGQFRCTQGEECINTQGSFQCITISRTMSTTVSPSLQGPDFRDSSQHCPAGFRYDAQHGRCFDQEFKQCDL